MNVRNKNYYTIAYLVKVYAKVNRLEGSNILYNFRIESCSLIVVRVVYGEIK